MKLSERSTIKRRIEIMEKHIDRESFLFEKANPLLSFDRDPAVEARFFGGRPHLCSSTRATVEFLRGSSNPRTRRKQGEKSWKMWRRKCRDKKWTTKKMFRFRKDQRYFASEGWYYRWNMKEGRARILTSICTKATRPRLRETENRTWRIDQASA